MPLTGIPFKPLYLVYLLATAALGVIYAGLGTLYDVYDLLKDQLVKLTIPLLLYFALIITHQYEALGDLWPYTDRLRGRVYYNPRFTLDFTRIFHGIKIHAKTKH